MSKPGPAARLPFDRFIEKTKAQEDGCIVWTASGNGDGYGAMFIAKGKRVLAHRWSYEHYIGPIPEGMVIDHLCRNRACVNPMHLEAVTHKENVLRGTAPSASNSAKTHCSRGHEFTTENTAVRSGKRECKVCHRAKARRYYYSNRERVLARLREKSRQTKEENT